MVASCFILGTHLILRVNDNESLRGDRISCFKSPCVGLCDTKSILDPNVRKITLFPLLSLLGHVYFKWCVNWHGFKNGYQEDMFRKEIGLRAQHTNTILSSIIDIIGLGGGVYDPFNEHKYLQFDNEQDIRTGSKNHEESGYRLGLNL